MFRFSLPLTSLFACLAISACSDEGVIRKPDGDGTGGKVLAEFRSSLDTPREEVIPDGPQIDPGAQNIDPFKYGLKYNYKEREVLAGLLEKAKQDPDYLGRSLAATAESLAIVAPEKNVEDYQRDLLCAVRMEIGARQGMFSAYEGQLNAVKLIKGATMPVPDEDLSEEDLEARRAALEAETARERYIREQEFKEEYSKQRTRDYLNYFLLKDQELAREDFANLASEVEACLPLVPDIDLDEEADGTAGE